MHSESFISGRGMKRVWVRIGLWNTLLCNHRPHPLLQPKGLQKQAFGHRGTRTRNFKRNGTNPPPLLRKQAPPRPPQQRLWRVQAGVKLAVGPFPPLWALGVITEPFFPLEVPGVWIQRVLGLGSGCGLENVKIRDRVTGGAGICLNEETET